MSEIEKIQKYIDNTKFESSRRYCMGFDETLELKKLGDEHPIDGIWLAFNYGRAKGYRAAKAEAKA